MRFWLNKENDNEETDKSNKSNKLNKSNESFELIPELVECKNLLNEVMNRIEAEPFNAPVDWQGLNLPDYPQIVKQPMDLGTILSKLINNKYIDSYDFAVDFRLVFENAKKYNTPGSGIFIAAENLHKTFERKFHRITKDYKDKKRKQLNKIKNISTFEDRQKFTDLLKKLNSNELGAIIELIDKKSPMAINNSSNDSKLY